MNMEISRLNHDIVMGMDCRRELKRLLTTVINEIGTTDGVRYKIFLSEIRSTIEGRIYSINLDTHERVKGSASGALSKGYTLKLVNLEGKVKALIKENEFLKAKIDAYESN